MRSSLDTPPSSHQPDAAGDDRPVLHTARGLAAMPDERAARVDRLLAEIRANRDAASAVPGEVRPEVRA